MRHEDFSFMLKTLACIEEKICSYCRLIDPQSSGGKIEEGKHSSIFINALNGTVSCTVYVYKKPNDDVYTIDVTAVDVKKLNRRYHL